jgi:hypothetical protein
LLGVPLFVDESLRDAVWLVFRAFGPSDFVEMTYEDFAGLEQPRIVPFAGGGALPPHVEPPPPITKRTPWPVFQVKPVAGAWGVFDQSGGRAGGRLPTQADAVGHAKELARRAGGAQIAVLDDARRVVSEFVHLPEEREALDADDRVPSFAATRPAHAHRK